jgi:glycosyltransferase involved in cell wall biosynthesis
MKAIVQPSERALADPRTDCRGRKVGILIVAYNAVTTLIRVLKRIPRDAWDNVAEVVVFDDASQDNTYELALGYKSAAQVDKLNVIRHAKNLGYGGNQKAGYAYFLEKGFDAVVLLHGDGQYAPEIISHLYHPIVAGGADAVFGSRMMKDYGGPLKGGMPLYKYVGNRILTAMENRAFHMKLTEFHSGYRAYGMEALSRIDFSKMTDDFHFDTEIIIKLHQQGFRIAEVPIPTYYGNEICYVNGMKYARDVALAVRRYRRTVQGIEKADEFAEYWVEPSIRPSCYTAGYYISQFASGARHGLTVHAGPSRLAANSGLPQVDCGAGYALDSGSTPPVDRMVVVDAIERVPEPEPLIASCRDALDPHGQALFVVPNVAHWTNRVRSLAGLWKAGEAQMRFYTRRSARRLLEEQGFEVAWQTATIAPRHGPRLLLAFLKAMTHLMPGLLGRHTILHVRRRLTRPPE